MSDCHHNMHDQLDHVDTLLPASARKVSVALPREQTGDWMFMYEAHVYDSCYDHFFFFTLCPCFLFPSLLSLGLCFFPFLWNAFHLNAGSLPTHCTWLYITLPFSLRNYPSFSWMLFPFLCSHTSLLFLNWHSLVRVQYIFPI